MHDIRTIREDPEAFDRALARRGLSGSSASLIALDERRRSVIQDLQTIQQRRNAVSKEIGAALRAKDKARADALAAEAEENSRNLPKAETAVQDAEQDLMVALSGVPNLPHADTPDGADEHGNVELHRFGVPASLEAPKAHYDLGEALGLLDFEAATRMSGARFAVLKGGLARLERALTAFMLDLHTGQHGYTEVAPPLLVRGDAMFGTAQLPKFRDDQFQVGPDLWAIPTAEVSLTNLVREQILGADELPMRVTAGTACFRAEAGAAGRDTRGLIRQHQFTKVELVSVTTPEQSAEEHERMLACAEEVLKRLELPFRTMTLCAGDMGFSAQKTYDIEVWLPAQNTYREISSCSVCGDFQARRMNARFRPADGGKPRFVHTLNGSGVAVGRALVAVMENYQQEDGSIAVPAVLQPYMGGLMRIGAL